MVPVAGGGGHGDPWSGAGRESRGSSPGLSHHPTKQQNKIKEKDCFLGLCSLFFVLVFHLFLTNTLPRTLGDPRVSTESLPHSECSKQTNRKKTLFHFFGVFALFLVLLLYLPDSSPPTWSTGLGTTHLHLAFGRGSSSLRPGQGWGRGGEGTGRGETFSKSKKTFQIACSSGTATTKKHQPDSHHR